MPKAPTNLDLSIPEPPELLRPPTRAPRVGSVAAMLRPGETRAESGAEKIRATLP